MASALERSRMLLAHGVSRIRSGLNAYERGLDEPGTEISVEPFDSRNVSTPAALIKLGTSIAAARRREANLRQARQQSSEGLELEREKTRSEIAKLRADEKYALGEGRQPAAAATPAGSQVIGQGKYKGWTSRDANADLADRRLGDAATARGERKKNQGRVAAARADLQQVEAEAVRRGNEFIGKKTNAYEAYFRQLRDPDPVVRSKAATAVGINPGDVEYLSKYPVEFNKMVDEARAGLRQRTVARIRAEAQKQLEPARQRALDVIRQGVEGFEEDPDNPLGLEGDPLGIEE